MATSRLVKNIIKDINQTLTELRSKELLRDEKAPSQITKSGNKTEISFKFSSAEVFEEAKKQLVDGGKFREALQYANLKSGNRVSTSFMYSSREELYTIVFLLKNL